MEMKSMLKATAIAALMASTTAAFAGPTATLTVTGKIIPGACRPDLGAGVINFDDTSVNQLPATGTLLLSARSLDVSIQCDNPSTVYMSFVDNRADSVPAHSDEPTAANTVFGLGKAGTINIGSYGLYISEFSGDGTVGDVLMSSDKTNWSKMSQDAFVNNSTTQQYVTYAATGSTLPKTAGVFNFKLNATPSLHSGLTAITDTANLDGNATINFEYQ